MLLENWSWGKMTYLEEQESFSPVILKDYPRAVWQPVTSGTTTVLQGSVRYKETPTTL